MLLREQTDAVPATGDIVTLRPLGIVGRVVQRDFGTAPDGGEELLIQLDTGSDGRRRSRSTQRRLTMPPGLADGAGVARRQSFIEYRQEHGIQPEDYGTALAAYLRETGGRDGDVERVDSSGTPAPTRGELQVEPADDDEAEHDE